MIRLPFVTRRRYDRDIERERIDRAEAVNSAIDWKRRCDDLRIVSRARALALDTLIRCNDIDALAIGGTCAFLSMLDAETHEVRTIACNELQRFPAADAKERA